MHRTANYFRSCSLIHAGDDEVNLWNVAIPVRRRLYGSFWSAGMRNEMRRMSIFFCLIHATKISQHKYI